MRPQPTALLRSAAVFKLAPVSAYHLARFQKKKKRSCFWLSSSISKTSSWSHESNAGFVAGSTGIVRSEVNCLSPHRICLLCLCHWWWTHYGYSTSNSEFFLLHRRLNEAPVLICQTPTPLLVAEVKASMRSKSLAVRSLSVQQRPSIFPYFSSFSFYEPFDCIP